MQYAHTTPLVGTLLDAGLTVVVISPNQLKNLRSRYGSAGNKDDRFDAYMLADTLRTDRARLRPLQPDTPATTTLRATVRARRDLSPTGSRSATNCAPTCSAPSPARSACSPNWTARSAWRSWPVRLLTGVDGEHVRV
jgi:Transposase